MSGGAQASIISDKYHLVVFGGISSWDYDWVRRNSDALGDALDKARPEFDRIFKESTEILGLKIADFNHDPFPGYVDGVLIENDPDKEKMAENHFKQYFSFKRSNVASADVRIHIPNTSFSATLSVLVTERVRRDDLEALLNTLVEVMKKSKDLNELLY